MKETALSGFLYHALEELDALAALFQGNNSLLLGGGVTAVHALAAVTAAHVDGVNLLDLDAEQLLNGLSDLYLVGIGGNLEGVLLGTNARHRVLGNDRSQDDVLCSFH